jgi:hypothetical protein
MRNYLISVISYADIMAKKPIPIKRVLKLTGVKKSGHLDRKLL